MKHINDFKTYLKKINYSEATIYMYNYLLEKANKYFKGVNIYDEKTINEKDILNYIKHLNNNDVSNWFFCRTVYGLKKYFNYLEKEKLIFINPVQNIEQPKEIRIPTKILTENEIEEAFSRININNDSGLRARTIVELLYSSSLRPRELINLKLSDIDFKNKVLFINQSKNKKDRVVPVTQKAIDWIIKYIKDVRPKFAKGKNSNYLFVGHYKGYNKLTNFRTLHSILKRVFIRDKINSFKASSLRPSSATHMLNRGMGILYIKELLGHSDVTTTKIYLRVKENDLKRELEKKHPRNKINKNNGGKR